MRQGRRTVQTETKYIELMVVNDHELVGVETTAQRSFFYSPLAITVVFSSSLTVCAAASIGYADQELCQSGGEHG